MQAFIIAAAAPKAQELVVGRSETVGRQAADPVWAGRRPRSTDPDRPTKILLPRSLGPSSSAGFFRSIRKNNSRRIGVESDPASDGQTGSCGAWVTARPWSLDRCRGRAGPGRGTPLSGHGRGQASIRPTVARSWCRKLELRVVVLFKGLLQAMSCQRSMFSLCVCHLVRCRGQSVDSDPTAPPYRPTPYCSAESHSQRVGYFDIIRRARN